MEKDGNFLLEETVFGSVIRLVIKPTDGRPGGVVLESFDW